MSEIKGPKFNCSACGREYRWKPELAGKKGKCKCGSVMQVPAQPPQAPEPELEDDLYDMAADEKPITPPAYTPATAVAAAPPSRAPAFNAPAASAPAGRQLHWAAAWKWLLFAGLFGAWAVSEFVSPTDPAFTGRVRKWRIVIMFLNSMFGMYAGAIFLCLLAGFFLVVGCLILLGKAKDSDYEHEQQQSQWPASRGRR